jgi:hypothetical protein
MDAIVSDRLDIKAQAWRVSFSKSPPKNQSVFMTIREPEIVVTTALPIEVAEALSGSVSRTKPSRWRGSGAVAEPAWAEKPLLLILVPADAANSKDMERQTKIIWPSEGESSQERLIRAGIRTSRVFWSDDRAIIFAAAEQSRDAIDAVLRFTIAERQTRALERQMTEMWSAINEHKSLVHAVKTRHQRFQKTVNRMTEKATLMMAVSLRLATALEQLDPALNSASKRLYAELVHQGGLYDRLEMLEDPIEFAMDHYELANTRLIEAKTFTLETRLELLISVLLAGELIIFSLPFFQHHIRTWFTIFIAGP